MSAWHADVRTLEGGNQRSVLALSNHSDEPVYDAVVVLVLIQGAGARTGEEIAKSDHLIHAYVRRLAVVPPGLWQVEVEAGWGGMYRAPGAEVAFTDRAGVHWVRRATGSLQEIDTPADDHYHLPRPMPVTLPQPLTIPKNALAEDQPASSRTSPRARRLRLWRRGI